jgi:hypothetical protein
LVELHGGKDDLEKRLMAAQGQLAEAARAKAAMDERMRKVQDKVRARVGWCGRRGGEGGSGREGGGCWGAGKRKGRGWRRARRGERERASLDLILFFFIRCHAQESELNRREKEMSKEAPILSKQATLLGEKESALLHKEEEVRGGVQLDEWRLLARCLILTLTLSHPLTSSHPLTPSLSPSLSLPP